jgi:hypothetical protein
VDSEAQISKTTWQAIGNESGAHVDSIEADLLGVTMNGDRILEDDEGNTVAVFPPDYAVVRDPEDDEEDADEDQ